MPKGLTMKEYPGSNNGRIIKWTNAYDTMILNGTEIYNMAVTTIF